MKIEDQVKFFLASMTLLGAGIAFTLKFLLDANGYPELSLVMLGIVAFFIGAMAFVGALAIWGILFADFATSFKPIWLETSVGKRVGLGVTVCSALAAMAVLVFIGLATFLFAVQSLSGSLSDFRAHLETQIDKSEPLSINQ